MIPPCTLPIDPWAVGSGQGGTVTLGPGREGWPGLSLLLTQPASHQQFV